MHLKRFDHFKEFQIKDRKSSWPILPVCYVYYQFRQAELLAQILNNWALLHSQNKSRKKRAAEVVSDPTLLKTGAVPWVPKDRLVIKFLHPLVKIFIWCPSNILWVISSFRNYTDHVFLSWCHYHFHKQSTVLVFSKSPTERVKLRRWTWKHTNLKNLSPGCWLPADNPSSLQPCHTMSVNLQKSTRYV